MSNFCNDDFWDSSLTWFTREPDFTQCFHTTALVYLPCLYLWVGVPFYLMVQEKRRILTSRRWLIATQIKITLAFVLFTLAVTQMGLQITRHYSTNGASPLSDVVAPGVQALTYGLVWTLILADITKGMLGLTSGYIWLK